MNWPTGMLIENAHVVRDLDSAMGFWSTVMGAGPFFVAEHDQPAELCQYRGNPSPLHVRVAFGMTGSMAIELVQQLSDAPSVFTEVLQQRGPGLHHLKFVTPGRQDEVDRLAQLGFPEVATMTVGAPDRLLSFVDTRPANGAFTEVMNFDHWQPTLESLLEAHHAWDGKTDPVRPWSELPA